MYPGPTGGLCGEHDLIMYRGREEPTKHVLIHNAMPFLCWDTTFALEVRGTLGLMERAGPVLLSSQRRGYTTLFGQPGSEPGWLGSFRWLCSDGHANFALNLFVLVLPQNQLRCCPDTASPGLAFGPAGGFGLLVSECRRRSCVERQRFCNCLAEIGHGTQNNPSWSMIYWVTCNCMTGFNKQTKATSDRLCVARIECIHCHFFTGNPVDLCIALLHAYLAQKTTKVIEFALFVCFARPWTFL